MTFNLENQTKLKEDICVFENFLTEEECESILKYWKYSVEKGTLPWEGISFYESYASNLPDDDDVEKFGLPRDFFVNLEKKIQESVEITRGKPVKSVSYHAQKWITGAFAGYHSDNSPLDDPEYNAFERSKWASFLYLNGDFEGGELKFRDHDISIKPKAGMLASFSGGHHNIHEVQIITDGERYTIGSFWDNEESEYSEETKEKWKTEIAEARIRQAEDQKLWQENKSKGIMEEPPPYQKERLKD